MNKKEIIDILEADNKSLKSFYDKSARIRHCTIGPDIYLRGLIELSNICEKDCYYCGIRKSNTLASRYYIDKELVVNLAEDVYKKGWGSLVIQSGELSTKSFIDDIAYILKEIKKRTADNFRITLSCGEQTEKTYKLWLNNGADRYLLRFETSSLELYNKYHPNDSKHNFFKRLESIDLLRKLGYQVGTGILIGTPLQTKEQLADDLLFIKKLDIDMLGMGPYIEHLDTPMYKKYASQIPSKKQRIDWGFKSLNIVRNLLPDINMASTTALETLDINIFAKALGTVANVFMPNVTPDNYKKDYKLYQNKISVNLDYIKQYDNIYQNIAFNQNGDSLHYKTRMYKNNFSKVCKAN